MKPTLNTIIVGAGGVASYMLPALNNSFELNAVLVDGDILETHNLDRQIFSKKDIGKNKAAALIAHNNFRDVVPLEEYIEDDFCFKHRDAVDGCDLVICLVDNHPARRAALTIAREAKIPILICANEYSTSQVQYWHPELGEEIAPDVRYPEIATSDHGSPINCTGEALESTPQLAIANQVSAALGNMLVWQWHGSTKHDIEAVLGHEVIEIQTTFSKVETITLNDL
jgi:molybdopterin/thiamine biosynthesis adenylyltransferase